MNIVSLSAAYIRARALTSILLIVLLAFGVSTISLLLHIHHQAQERLSRDAFGIDLVVGAKGSPLQIILSSIYHMDIPTGNILLSDVERLKKHPQVKQAIPLALGDSYRGFRIVGTEISYIEHYKAALADGQNFAAPLEAVIGAQVAQSSSLTIGAEFAGSHGLADGGDVHADTPYRVVGILKPTGTVIDRLIITPVESVWKVHGSEVHSHHHHHHDHHQHKKAHDVRQEITALLIRYRSPAAAMSLPREINRMTSMQAASPPFETARLLSLLGMGLDALKFFGLLLMVSAAVGMLVAIYQSMRERRIDIALMRVMGAPKIMLVKQIMIEAGLLLLAGIVMGLCLSHALLALLPWMFEPFGDMRFMPLQLLAEEIYSVAALLVAGLCVAALPALTVYRIDVSQILSRG